MPKLIIDDFEDDTVYDAEKIEYTGTALALKDLGAGEYAMDNPVVSLAFSVFVEGINSFSVSQIVTDDYFLRFILCGLWFDGLSWVVSDGSYAQSNTADEITANIAALVFAEKTELTVSCFLHSADGLGTPELESLEINYSPVSIIPEEIQTCRVWFDFREIDPSLRATRFVCRLNEGIAQYKNTVMIKRGADAPFVVDENGRAELTLIENANMKSLDGDPVFYDVYATCNSMLRKFATISVPATDSENIFDIMEN
jgi:hypothetical protein